MRKKAKRVGELTAGDLSRHRVWEYDIENETLPGHDETWVVPVTDLPVNSLANRVVGVPLRFGQRRHWGLLGNITLNDLQRTREFITLSVRAGTSWFHLARYFDFDRRQRGPRQLAKFLSLSTSDVFPIHYDLFEIALGHPQVIRGRIDAKPQTPLDDSERMALILSRE